MENYIKEHYQKDVKDLTKREYSQMKKKLNSQGDKGMFNVREFIDNNVSKFVFLRKMMLLQKVFYINMAVMVKEP